jgi:tetratricopeptide (TPR) repeat protein
MLSLLLLAAAASMGEAPQVATFEQSISRSDFNDARSALNTLIELRTPSDGKPRQDPLLDALIGRYYLAMSSAEGAAVYLNHSLVAELPPALRAPTALDHGRALERTGHRRDALEAYREAAGSSTTETQQRQASLGIALQLLPEDPAAARSLVTNIANGAATPQRWEAKLIVAAASSLAGDPKSASKLADEAWTDAIDAPMTDLAGLRVATLRAGLAAARHDVATERAMLTTTNGLSLSPSNALGQELPVCGDDGVRPSDYVIFGFVSGPYLERELFPIAASRVEAVRPFYDALSQFVPVKEAINNRPLGTVFTVSCRTVVHPDYVANRLEIDPLFEWFVQHSFFPARIVKDADDEQLNAVAARADAIAGRFGKDSPLLLVPRWETLNMLQQRATAGDDVLPGQLIDLSAQVAAGLRLARAPEWLASGVEARADLYRAYASGGPFADQLSYYQAKATSELARMPLAVARQGLSEFEREFEENGRDDRIRTVLAQVTVSLKDKAPTDLNPRERQAWFLTVARSQRSLGEIQHARSTIAAAGFEKELCAAMDGDVELLEQHFSENDYPPDLNVGLQEGVTTFDFDVTPSGRVGAHRILYSLPSGLFDEVSEKGLSTVRYQVPKMGGKSSACRGIVQPIVWRLEEPSHQFAPPRFIPHTPGDVT